MRSSEVVTAVARALYQATKYPVFVDAQKQNDKFPCFYINRLDDGQDLHLGDRYLQSMELDVLFFPSRSGEIGDREKCADMADVLVERLEYVRPPAGLIRGTGIHWRITDNILHLFVTYEFFVRRRHEPTEKMETLKTEGSISDGREN